MHRRGIPGEGDESPPAETLEGTHPDKERREAKGQGECRAINCPLLDSITRVVSKRNSQVTESRKHTLAVSIRPGQDRCDILVIDRHEDVLEAALQELIYCRWKC